MINTPKRITVLGSGSWGGTIAQLLASKDHHITAWHIDEKEVQYMLTKHRHPYIDYLQLSPAIRFTTDLDSTIPGAEILLVAVPSHAVRSLFQRIAHKLETDTTIVNLTKGIENDTLLTMSQVIREVCSLDAERIVTLYGPSHAEEVAQGLPTTLVAASTSMETATTIQHMFSSPSLRVYTNDDILGVEIAGSVKNVIAIAAGICDGIGFGDNTKAALLTRGITELTRLGKKMGARPETFYGLSGIGDLIATCLSRHSRNRYVGEEIGKGRTLQEVLDGMQMIAEGVKTALSVHQLGKKYDVELPISKAVYEVLFEQKPPRDAVTELMTRNLTKEGNI